MNSTKNPPPDTDNIYQWIDTALQSGTAESLWCATDLSFLLALTGGKGDTSS